MKRIVAFAAVLLLAGSAWAALSPGQKCQSRKNLEAGKYANCLAKAEAKLLTIAGTCSVTSATVCHGAEDCPLGESCTTDLSAYGAVVTKRDVGSPAGTVWQWVAALNTASFAGHNDWRLGTKSELLSILDDADTAQPIVNVAFHGASCGAACTDVNNPACSCTRAFGYWSATTYSPNTTNARTVDFSFGALGWDHKPNVSYYVRAVRGGS